MDPALTGRVLALLAHQRDSYGLARTVAGIASLVGAGIFLGGGLLLWDSAEPLFWSLILTTPIFLSVGIAALVWTLPQEDRYERFKLAFADGMSPLEYATLSGELLAESNLARSQRMFGGAASLGIAGTGALAILALSQLYPGTSGPTTAFLDSLAYTIPGAFVLAGVFGAIYAFLVKTQPEKDWDALQAGVPAESLALDVRVSPFVTADGGGLAAVGRF